MKIIYIILFLSVISFTHFLKGQTLLLEENFDYGIVQTDLVTASSSIWTNHSGGTGGSDVQYLITGLTYSGYISSGIGGSASLSNLRTGDDNRSFTSQSSGSVYLSALVNVTSATTGAGGEYILHFGISTYYARLYVKSSGVNLLFGISKSSEGATFSSINFSFSTTYLIVIKYTFLSSAQDDRVDMWVMSSGVPSSEVAAGTPTIENVTAATTDATSLSIVSLRQGSASHLVTVDGIRVSDSWSEAPLPVELSSFSASIINSHVKLFWQTETEVNNYGFDVERSSLPGMLWNKIGFVEGAGNSNSPKEYSFVDHNVQSGKYSYRLKQIDNDGTFTYSNSMEIDVSEPLKYELSQNYPNPFNPRTTIIYSVPKSGRVNISLYDVLGEMVEVILNKFCESGSYKIDFDAENLESGVYFYKIEANGFSNVKKMCILK